MSTVTSVNGMVRQAIEAGSGILRLAPTWVPRSYLVPGRRLKPDTRDLYAYGSHRGGIDERWFASTTPASGGNPFFSEIILHFERATDAHGYEALISFADTETKPDHVVTCATRMQQRQVDGIAVLTFGMEDYLRQLPIEVPMVYGGGDDELPLRNIRINYFSGIRDAVKHLADFGHERIGYLSGQLLWRSSMGTRFAAFRKALRVAGLTFHEELVAECDHTWDDSAARHG